VSGALYPHVHLVDNAEMPYPAHLQSGGPAEIEILRLCVNTSAFYLAPGIMAFRSSPGLMRVICAMKIAMTRISLTNMIKV